VQEARRSQRAVPVRRTLARGAIFARAPRSREHDMTTRTILIKSALRAMCGVAFMASGCASERPSPTDNAEPNSLAPPVEGPPPQQSAADQETEAQREESQLGKPPSPAAPAPRGAAESPQPDAARAAADLEGIGGATVDGQVTLEERGDNIAVRVHVTGATPGPLSVRVFADDDCENIQAGKLAKPFNATLQHGEIGNFTAGKDGMGTLEASAAKATLRPLDHASLLGKAIVVQARDTAGDASGKPLACGVIKLHEARAGTSGQPSSTTAMRAH
jgi:Cu/Zn superoxide dismutase